jgi:hypothetical protein
MELLKSAANTAKKYELSKVEIWDPSELLLDASKVVQGQKVNRQDSLSSLLFFDAPDHTFSWKWNEKYAWV